MGVLKLFKQKSYPNIKKGDKRYPKNCRGINILNACYKIYSKIINRKLQQYSEKFICEKQNGFRKGRSCAEAIYISKLLHENGRNAIWKRIYYLYFIRKLLTM
jgi:hypothetical protein